MFHTTNLSLQPPTKHTLHPPHTTHPPQIHSTLPSSTTPSPKALERCSKLSRRDLALFAKSSLLLLISQPTPHHRPSIAWAEEEIPSSITTPSSCGERVPTKRAFLDVSIDGEPVGKIVIGLYGNDAPLGASRFSDLITGRAGISYRRKEFTKIMPNYVQHSGVRSYGVDAELARRTGSGNLVSDVLVEEWRRVGVECSGTKNVAGSVSIVVRDPNKPAPKVKLVARKGKLEIDQEEVGVEPNGTEFLIVTKDSPELDESALVIGRVVEGMDVVRRIGTVKTVQENATSPYFRVAKLIGDKRAVVAERGFNRPYSKIVVTNCSLLE